MTPGAAPKDDPANWPSRDVPADDTGAPERRMMFSRSIPETPPTTGLELRFYKGEHSTMLREIADFIDEHADGRLIVGIWATFDDQEEVHTMEVVVTHDEDAYMDIIESSDMMADGSVIVRLAPEDDDE